MRYVCSVCGYVYDEGKEKRAFSDLPDSWVCPLCGASKSLFAPEKKEGEGKKAAPVAAPVRMDGELEKLPAGVLAALCSNLARGCEKQYKQEESELFAKLAKYFADITPAEETAEAAEISKLIQSDLEHSYADVNSTAGNKKDRGALRVCVWGEKVTRILNTLMQKYEKEGEAFLAETEVWVCTVCGFVFVGDKAPELCPVCKVPSWKFEKIERRTMR